MRAHLICWRELSKESIGQLIDEQAAKKGTFPRTLKLHKIAPFVE